jgi:uncharacterized RDD family membrane protein YckC
MSMSQGGESSQPWDATQHTGDPGQQRQSSTPGQGGVPSQGGVPGRGDMPARGGVPAQSGREEPEQWGQHAYGFPAESGQQYGYPSETVADPQATGPMPARPISPVNETETRVTGRRVVQYIIDYAITGIVAAFVMWVLDRGSGAANAGLLLIGAVLSAAWYFWYWVYRPYHANGQTFGMRLLGLRIISKSGGRASMLQLFIRGVLLIVDTLVWGLVGLVTILCSRYRQRVGDHVAKTLVVRARTQAMPAPREYAGAGQAGSR